MAASLLRAIGQTAKGDGELMTIYRQIETLAGALRGQGSGEGSASLAKSEEELFALHRRILARRFKEGLIVWRKDPWSAFTPLDTPRCGTKSDAAVRFDLAQNGWASNAIVLTHNESERTAIQNKREIGARFGRRTVAESA